MAHARTLYTARQPQKSKAFELSKMVQMRLLFLLSWLVNTVLVASSDTDRCESLKLKPPLTYTQDKAPRDLSGVLPVVVEKVNRVLEGVVDVEVEWEGGDLHGKVGEHTVQCKVTRLVSAIQEEHLHEADVSTDDDGREVVVQCFLVPFTILDTNECTLSSGHSMRHKCHAPSICVNTIGSYECLCPRLNVPKQKLPNGAADDQFWANIAKEERSPWELSLNSTDLSSCPSSASTHGCCPAFGHSSHGSLCRSNFRCPIDACGSSHDCAPNAQCQLADTPRKRPNFTCKCPNGLMGNGHACRPGIDVKPEPKVMYDGVTPTEETLKHNYYCGCTAPVIDACAGFPPCKGHNEVCAVGSRNEPKCVCKPGYVRDEQYGCVDETPPVMKLRHDMDGNHTLRLRQGDLYKEYAVDIIDENAEEYLRSLRISYSKPLPPGCLTKIGEFHVNYTVATPWTSPPYVRVTRKVTIDDIDECTLDQSKYESSCPEIIPQCDVQAGATCVNTIGSYKCRCPEYTAGDGFKSLHATSMDNVPEGYKGGTGCVDTSLPIIDVLGPNPKVFKVCKCDGLKGIMGGPNASTAGDQLCREQRKRYESSIREMILSTAGAELCATHGKPNPKPGDCVKAIDHTYKGNVDLSARVVVGEPVQKSSNHWKVSYNVMDDAGNAAKTVWRDVLVEEVDLFEDENKLRLEMQTEKEAEIKEAVRKALEKERASRQVDEVTGGPTGNKRNQPARASGKCPPCPECKCPTDGSFDPSQCDKYCQDKFAQHERTCKVTEGPYPIQFLHDVLPPQMVYVVVWCAAIFLVIFTIRLLATTIFNPSATFTSYNLSPAEEHEFQNAVNYYRSPEAVAATNRVPQSAPPRPFGGTTANGGASMFSPDNRGMNGNQYARPDTSPFWSPNGTPGSAQRGSTGLFDENNIYADSPMPPRGRR